MMDVGKMEYVPTLCALGTLGIGAAGFALGCEEQYAVARPPSNKRKASGLGEVPRPLSSTLLVRKSRASRVVSLPDPGVRGPQNWDRKERGRQGREGKPLFRWNTSQDGAPTSTKSTSSRQSSRTPSLSFMSRQDEDQSAADRKTSTKRLSTSWLKRLSTGSLLNETPLPLSPPASPSVSVSNTSATPILPSTKIPPPLPPNKLVKRTNSHRAPSSHFPQSSTFRRPATSHQRTVSLLRLASEDDDEPALEHRSSMFVQSDAGDSNTPHIWRPYFGSGFTQSSGNMPRKRHTSGSSRTNPAKTIRKFPDSFPTLLMASAVRPRVSTDGLDDIRERSYIGSPVSPVLSDDMFEISFPAAQPTTSDKTRRRTFSISDLFASTLSRTENKKNNRHSIVGTDKGRNLVNSSRRSLKKVASSEFLTRGEPDLLQNRRSITDPTQFQPKSQPRVGLNTQNHDVGSGRNRTTSPIPSGTRFSSLNSDIPSGTPFSPLAQHSESQPHHPSTARAVSSPNPPTHLNLPRSRISLGTSRTASTTFGSENDTRVFSSGDEDYMDFLSDTAYDSLATRATVSSHSGLRGRRIETIFDESPPLEDSKAVVSLERLVQERRRLDDIAKTGAQDGRLGADKDSGAQLTSLTGNRDDVDRREFSRLSTPVVSTMTADDQHSPTTTSGRETFEEQTQSSSPPPSSPEPHNSHSQKMEDVRSSFEAMWNDEEGDDWAQDDSKASYFDDTLMVSDSPRHSMRRTSPLPIKTSQDTRPALQQNGSTGKTDKRISLFDWSEQPISDKDSPTGSSIRPKTVHGKHGLDMRGTRSSGRRGPSTVHLRSQSVPVTREATLEKEFILPAAKYGTWGLGNKGASEEWNDDFEFDEAEGGESQLDEGNSQKSAQNGMKVPQAIIDRQASVQGQFGQVQEFMLLVEELKRLRTQGSALQLIDGPSRQLWEDAESIVNLATLNDEDDLRPPLFPVCPSDFDDFGDDEDEEVDERTAKHPTRKQSSIKDDDASTRNSISRRAFSGPATPPTGRPRGESLAQAKSFLQTIHQNRNGPDSSPAGSDALHSQPKLPFDTQDLRDLVLRTGVVTRSLKDLVRKAEGVSPSPLKTPKKFSDPPLSQIFVRPDGSPSPKFKKPGLPKSRSANSYLGSSIGSSIGSNNENDISGHMKMMTVV